MLIQGKTTWCRVTGAPHANKFNPAVPQWSFDLSVDEETQSKLLKLGVRKNTFKDKGDDRGTFISFTRNSVKADGTAGKPFDVKDAQGETWDDSVKIGNGSVLNVIVMLSERQFGSDKFLKPSALKIQVWGHVPYTGNDGEFPTREASAETPEVEKEW